LGSSTFGARLAARLGLPYAFASHFAPTYLMEALHIYRKEFIPSKSLSSPYAMACVNVMAADTTAEAQKLATSFYQMARGIVTNERKPLQPPVDTMEGIWDEMEKAAVMQMMRYSFIGSIDDVSAGLENFAQQTGVNEIMVGSHIYDNEARLHSYSLLAPLFKKG
jgi:luciferase family oxidoreductase group 1